MRKPVCWVERLDEGGKREVRVTIAGGRIRWQMKRSDEEAWNYTPALTDEDWSVLQTNMERRYQRRNVPFKDLELVKKLRAGR